MAKEVKEEKNSKIAALEAAIDHINKQYGAGAVMKLGENTHMTVETIPTGSLSLDLALGVGGVPKGRIIEIYGPESGGKTTIALHMVAEVQKTGGVAAFIDAEHALDPSYARKSGSTLMIFMFRSRTAESRHWRLQRQWFGQARWILWLLTLWPP